MTTDVSWLADHLAKHSRQAGNPMRCTCGHYYPDNGYNEGSWTMVSGPAIHEARELLKFCAALEEFDVPQPQQAWCAAHRCDALTCAAAGRGCQPRQPPRPQPDETPGGQAYRIYGQALDEIGADSVVKAAHEASRRITICPNCLGSGKDPVAVALERAGAVLDMRCYDCNGTGTQNP